MGSTYIDSLDLFLADACKVGIGSFFRHFFENLISSSVDAQPIEFEFDLVP